jgi:hypothetical protein
VAELETDGPIKRRANDPNPHDKRFPIQGEPSPSAVLDADREKKGVWAFVLDHHLRHNLNSDLDYLPMSAQRNPEMRRTSYGRSWKHI